MKHEKRLKSYFNLAVTFKANCVFNENKSYILAPDIGAILSRLKYP